jgi:hypothetical protein
MKSKIPKMLLLAAGIALGSQSMPTHAQAYSYGSGTGGGCAADWYNNQTPAPASVATTNLGTCLAVSVDAAADDADLIAGSGISVSDYDPGWTTSSFHGISYTSSAFFFLVY